MGASLQVGTRLVRFPNCHEFGLENLTSTRQASKKEKKKKASRLSKSKHKGSPLLRKVLFKRNFAVSKYWQFEVVVLINISVFAGSFYHSYFKS